MRRLRVADDFLRHRVLIRVVDDFRRAACSKGRGRLPQGLASKIRGRLPPGPASSYTRRLRVVDDVLRDRLPAGSTRCLGVVDDISPAFVAGLVDEYVPSFDPV